MALRNIKFRIWDKNRRCWCENDSSLHCFSDWVIGAFNGSVGDAVGEISGKHEKRHLTLFESGEESPFIVQQYTGIKDKYGREIFEGDLCRFWFYITHGDEEKGVGEVFWHEESAGFLLDKDHWFSFNQAGLKEVEVVGNIFEEKIEQCASCKGTGRDLVPYGESCEKCDGKGVVYGKG